MFEFKFGSSESPTNVPRRDTNDLKWTECKEIKSDLDVVRDVLENVTKSSFKTEICSLEYVNSEEIVNFIKTKHFEEISALKAEENHSDLMPAIYEGGLKIWECTYDLLHFLQQNHLNFTNKLVLDLGCGAGLLGIFAVKQGATCYFQDYNEEVLKYMTIPNISLNCNTMKTCRTFFGDWESFTQKLVEEHLKFDYILTSETIYNTDCYSKLHELFKTVLKSDGVIYLSAKSFYFGVGGGVGLFQKYLVENGVFKWKTCWEHIDGVKRAILEISFI